jgi:bacteriocin biosynthesis cyclodehydratase domain-containing protein
MRPALLPHLRRLWRDHRSLQLGTDPRRATVLEFAEPASARFLDLLDGTRTESQIITDAALCGVPVEHSRALLRDLHSIGLLVDEYALVPRGMPTSKRQRLAREAAALALSRLDDGRPSVGPPSPADILRRRAATHVMVAGHGPLGATIAAGLAQAGIGHVDPALDGWTTPADALIGGFLAADDNRSRASAAADAVRRAAPEVDVSPLRSGTAGLLVMVGARAPNALAARGFRDRGIPRLDVTIRDGVVMVGPLVVPGTRPCARCLELHRTDRDPAWPVLAAQLATARDTPEPCAVSTALAGAAYAIMEVLDFVDGRNPRTRGAAVEIATADRPRRRSWPPHPGCDCARGARPGRRG